MRQILEAVKVGRRETVKAVASFPHRHPFLIAGVGIFMLILLLGAQIHTAGQVEVLRQQSNICEQRATLDECADQLRKALVACGRDHRCHAALMADVRSQRWRKEVMHQNPSPKTGQQPGPADEAGSGTPAAGLPLPPLKVPVPEVRLPEVCAAGIVCVGR